MSRENQPRFVPTAFGIALAMGCFITAFAAITILIGLALDSVFNFGRRFATLGCVMVGLPINVYIALRLSQILFARLTASVKPVKKEGSPTEQNPPREPDAKL